MARFLFITLVFSSHFFSAISQGELDSARIICGPQNYKQISFEEVLWIFRNKSRQSTDANPLELQIDKLDANGKARKIYGYDSIDEGIAICQ
jgi:hypothetical protein